MSAWINFSDAELNALRDMLTHGVSYLNPNRQAVLDRITHFTSPESTDQTYRDAAQELVRYREGEIEVDDDAVVSPSEDGAYVMAWVWVEKSDG